nr:hypothetical protein [Trichoderma harzianum]
MQLPRIQKVISQRKNILMQRKGVKHARLVRQRVQPLRLVPFKRVPALFPRRPDHLGVRRQPRDFSLGLGDYRGGEGVVYDGVAVLVDLTDELLDASVRGL